MLYSSWRSQTLRNPNSISSNIYIYYYISFHPCLTSIYCAILVLTHFYIIKNSVTELCVHLNTAWFLLIFRRHFPINPNSVYRGFKCNPRISQAEGEVVVTKMGYTSRRRGSRTRLSFHLCRHSWGASQVFFYKTIPKCTAIP